MQEQAERFGTEVKFDTVTAVDFSQHPFAVTTYEKEYHAKSVIICTGASPRTLDIPGEEKYGGRGVSYCATCDGFFFQDQRLIVVGGGDAALEEGIFLTKYASEVYIVHRRDQLRASQIMQERAFKNDKIKFIWDTIVEEINGDADKVTGATLKNVKTGETQLFPIDGVFIFIGHIPKHRTLHGCHTYRRPRLYHRRRDATHEHKWRLCRWRCPRSCLPSSDYRCGCRCRSCHRR